MLTNYRRRNLWHKIINKSGEQISQVKRKVLPSPLVRKVDIVNALNLLGIEQGAVLMVHSSLSSFGTIEGGAETVIDAFIEVLGSSGTLLMPSFSRLETRHGEFGSWWNVSTSPVYTGAISNTFWQRDDVLRSNHPTHSVAAWGKLAKTFSSGHEHTGDRPSFWGTGVFSTASPWQKMVDLNVTYMLFGCGHGPTTLAHLVETILVHKHIQKLRPSCRESFIERLRHNLYAPSGVWPDINRFQAGALMQSQRQLSTVKLGLGNIKTFHAKNYCEILLQRALAYPHKWIHDDYMKCYLSFL